MNIDLQLIISLIAAAGLGSIFTTFIQGRLISRRDNEKRKFEEKKEAYVGLLRSFHDAAVERSDKASKEFAFWQLRCELVSPSIVREAIQGIVNTNEDPSARSIAYDKLKDALRDDLGITDT